MIKHQNGCLRINLLFLTGQLVKSAGKKHQNTPSKIKSAKVFGEKKLGTYSA